MRSGRFKERAPDKFAERLRMSACRAHGCCEQVNAGSNGVTPKLFIKPSSNENRRARGRFEQVRVVRMPRPPYGGACESMNSRRHRIYIDRLLLYSRFVKEQRRKFSRAGVLYPHTPKLLRDVTNMLLYVT